MTSPFSPHTYTAQQQIVLDQLYAGRSLTNIVALTCHGVGSLSSRIAELRKMGHQIGDRQETDQFERQYKVYFIKAAKLESAMQTIEADIAQEHLDDLATYKGTAA